MEETNATLNEGASTLDRLERYLAAEEAPAQTKQEPASADVRGKTAEERQSVEPESGGTEQEAETQITTSDLAKFLGVDENVIDLDEDGTVKLKTKIDGKEGAAKLAEMLKSYQLEGHVNKKSMELAEREKAMQARQQEAEQQFTQRLQYAENLVNVAAQDLLREFQSVPWAQLEAENPGHAALMRQKFQERQAQLRGILHNVEVHKTQGAQKAEQERRERLAQEAARLPELIPEWKDASVAERERQEIRSWAIKSGFEADEVDNITSARQVAALRKAMLHDKLQSTKPEIENKVRTAPKLVKPGQTQPTTQQEQTLRGIKQTIQKSGGKKGIEDFLIASGKV